jgi:hypothetical protein
MDLTQTLKNAALAGVAAVVLATSAMVTVSSADAQAMRGYGERGFFPGIASSMASPTVASSNFGYQNWPYAPSYYGNSFGTPYGYRPYGY